MDSLEAVQWFFYLDPVSRGFNWPIDVGMMVDGKQSIDKLVSSKASAVDVEAAYRAFAGAVGPTVMTALLISDDAFPEVNHSGNPTPPSGGKVTLYVDTAGKRVLAQTTMEWGQPPTFSVE